MTLDFGAKTFASDSIGSRSYVRCLVQRRVAVLPELFDFILEEKFSALEFDDTKIVGGQMSKSLVQFTLENAVFSFQFNEMRLNRHIKPPRAGMNLKRDLDDEVYMTWEICR